MASSVDFLFQVDAARGWLALPCFRGQVFTVLAVESADILLKVGPCVTAATDFFFMETDFFIFCLL